MISIDQGHYDEVDLAGVAAPVAVEHDHALLDQVPGGDRLAVRPE